MNENELAPPLKLRVVSPTPDLGGLDKLHARLMAVRKETAALQMELNKPLATAAIRSVEGAGLLRTHLVGDGSRNVKKLARAFGFDASEFEKYVADNAKKIKKVIQTSRDSILDTTGNFTSDAAANRALRDFSKEHQKRTLASFAALQKMGAVASPAVAGSGAVKLDVSPQQIVASTPPNRGSVVPSAPPSAGGVLIGVRSVFQDEPEIARVQRTVDQLGNEFDTFFKEVDGELQATGKVVKKESRREIAKRRVRDAIAAERDKLASAEQTNDKEAIANARVQVARAIRRQLAGKDSRSVLGDTFFNKIEQEARSLETKAGKELTGIRRGKIDRAFTDRLAKIQRNYEDAIASNPANLMPALAQRKQDLMRLTANPERLSAAGVSDAHVRQALNAHSKAGLTVRQALEDQAKKEAREADKRRKAFEERSEFYKQEKEDARRRAEMGRKQLADLNASLSDQERQDRRRRGAHALFGGRRKAGDTVRSERFEGGRLVSASTTGVDPSTGAPLVHHFDFEKGRVQVDRLAKSLRGAREETAKLGRNIIDNTIHVTTWASGVAILYGSLNLAQAGFAAFLDTGAQAARLDQVFRGVGGSTQELVGDVLELASAERRLRGEALEAAIAWSRLGLTRQEINKAVKVSLQAANVAEISAADATEQLAAVMVAFRLNVDDLASVLGQLNQVSNTYRVTNRDLLAGIARTGGVAKQAGLDLAQLIGIIGAGVGATGQSGENIGNAVKTIITKLGNPGLQERLQSQFQLNLTTDTGDLKAMSQILADLYVRYQDLNEAQRASLRFQVAGAFQSSRLAAILDSYVKAQTLAVHAQLNLNSAQEENQKIIATLQANLQGLVSELERFASTQPVFKVAGAGLNEFVQFLRHLLDVSNNLPTITTLFLGTLGLMGAKLSLVAVQTAQAANQGGLLVNTWKRMQSVAVGLSGALHQVLSGFADRNSMNPFKRFAAFSLLDEKALRSRAAINRAIAASPDFSVAHRGAAKLGEMMQRLIVWSPMLARGLRLAAGAAAVLGSMFTMTALWAGVGLVAMVAFNRGMDYLGRSSDRATSKLDLLTDSFQRTKNAAGAAATTLQLYDTVLRSLGSLDLSGSQAKDLVESVADVAFPDESGKKDRPKTRALRDEMEALRVIGDLEGLRQKVQEQQVLAVVRRRNEEQRAYELNEDRLKTARDEVDRLKSKPFASAKAIAAAEKKVSEYEAEKVEAAASLLKINRELADVSPEIQHSLERQKTVLSEISELYSSFPAATNQQRVALERLNIENEMRSLRSMVDIYNDRQKTVDDRGKGEDKEKKALDGRKKQLRGVVTEIEREIARMEGNPTSILNVFDVDELTEKRAKILAEIDAVQAKMDEVGKGTVLDDSELEALREAANSRLKELEKAKAGLEAKEQFAAVKDQIALRRAVTEADIEGFSGGANRTESLLNRFRGLSRSLVRGFRQLDGLKAGDPSAGRIREDIAIRGAALERTRLDLIRQSGELRKQEMEVLAQQTKELERQLALSKPEDLLRYISAKNAALRGNVGLGEFFSASPELRQNLQLLIPGLDPRIRDIRSQQAAVAPYQPSSDLLNRSVQEQVDAAIRKTAADHEAAAEAGRLAASLANTTNALKGFQSQLDSFAAFIESKVPNTSYNPQGGGKR